MKPIYPLVIYCPESAVKYSLELLFSFSPDCLVHYFLEFPYVVCGIVMLISLGSIIVLKIFSIDQSILLPETFAVIAFGIAWLAKGKAILKD
jgi:hypothetical protein